jgi:hypothetical protein
VGVERTESGNYRGAVIDFSVSWIQKHCACANRHCWLHAPSISFDGHISEVGQHKLRADQDPGNKSKVCTVQIIFWAVVLYVGPIVSGGTRFLLQG